MINTIENTFTPHAAIHPGLNLKRELAEKDLKQNELAAEIGVMPSLLNEVIKGKRPITPDLSVLLGAALDCSSNKYNDLQSKYNLDLLLIDNSIKEKVEAIKNWRELKEYVPVSYFRKEDVLIGEPRADIKQILKILGLKSVQEAPSALGSTKAAGILFKKSGKLFEHTAYVNSWLLYTKYLAGQQSVANFDFDSKQEMLDNLKSLFQKKDVLDKLPVLLAKYGIKVVIKGKPDHAPLDGAAYWDKENPVIGLTIRHKRFDNLLFTVYHELAHIYLHLRKDKDASFVDSLEDLRIVDQKEEEANNFARNAIIPNSEWANFTLGRVDFSDDVIRLFANRLSIPGASVWWRLCFEGYLKYSGYSVHRNNNHIP